MKNNDTNYRSQQEALTDERVFQYEFVILKGLKDLVVDSMKKARFFAALRMTVAKGSE